LSQWYYRHLVLAQVLMRKLVIIILLIETGLRREEVINIDVGDIHHEEMKTAVAIKGKGRQAKDQRIYVTEETLDILYEYLGLRHIFEDDYEF
jgi:integrase